MLVRWAYAVCRSLFRIGCEVKREPIMKAEKTNDDGQGAQKKIANMQRHARLDLRFVRVDSKWEPKCGGVFAENTQNHCSIKLDQFRPLISWLVSVCVFEIKITWPRHSASNCVPLIMSIIIYFRCFPSRCYAYLWSSEKILLARISAFVIHTFYTRYTVDLRIHAAEVVAMRRVSLLIFFGCVFELVQSRWLV